MERSSLDKFNCFFRAVAVLNNPVGENVNRLILLNYGCFLSDLLFKILHLDLFMLFGKIFLGGQKEASVEQGCVIFLVVSKDLVNCANTIFFILV